MNLDEMLLYADIDQINSIADKYQCECDRHSKSDMIQAIIYKILKKDTIQLLLSKLDKVEYTLIQLLYLDSRSTFTIEDLLAKAKQSIQLNDSKTNARDLVLKVLKMGIIFQGVGKKHLLVYLVPEDLKRRILRGIKGHLIEKTFQTKDVSFYRDERNLLIADTEKFLKFLINEEVILTNDGNIYKRQQSIIFKTFHVSEEPLKKVAWRFGYGRRYNEYPDRFSLIYDYVYYKKLIQEDQEGQLYITPSGGKWLMTNNFLEEEKRMYQFWVRLYKQPIPYLQYVIKIIDLVAYNAWVEIESLEKIVLFWLNDYYYEKKNQVFNERIIKMLFHLGIIQIGNDHMQNYLRITEEGHRLINGLSFDVKEIVLD